MKCVRKSQCEVCANDKYSFDAPNLMTRSRTKALAVIVVAIVVVAAVSFYFISQPVHLSVSVASSTSVGTAGSPITFTVIPTPSSASISSVLWNFGDGVNQTVSGATAAHTYANGGRYLVLAQVTATYQNFLLPGSAIASNNAALFPLTIEANFTQNGAQEGSVPTIDFPSSTNPTAPIFNVGETVSSVGGFLELPADSNWTIQEYSWNFANGNSQTVNASNETGDPIQNVTASYSNPGLYPLSLTLTTTSNGESFSVTTMRTIAVQSSSFPFAVLTTSSGVQNPGVITSAEVASGGPYSFDPQIDYETLGFEVLQNVVQTLVQYNGSSTVSFIPYLAQALPTQQNGGISADYTTYTFQIRNNQYFSNGDPVTAYDVWFSFARCLAFAGGTPGDADWILSQFLIPGGQNGTATVYGNNTWQVATTSILYSNATNMVTLRFNRPMLSSVVFQILADPLGAGIVDSRYAWSQGAGFNEATWTAYMNQANGGSYNAQMQWSPVGSGPYMIAAYTPGQSVELVPNPHFNSVPGIPQVTATVVIDWVKTADTALLMLQDGQADTISYMPSSDFPAVQKLQSQGLVNIYNDPGFWLYVYMFNIEIDKQLETSQFGTGFNEPSNYFADLPTRMAWINAYDYAGYLNNILGNAKYGATFGIPFTGAIAPGMSYAVPPDQVGGLPTQNLNDAKGNYSISAWANQQITIPIVVPVGDQAEIAGAEEWAGTLSQISNGNIIAKVVQVTSSLEAGDLAENANPMPVSFYYWASDYPSPSDNLDAMYLAGGYFTGANNLLVSNFASLAPSNPNGMVHINGTAYSQAQVYGWINGNVTLGDTSFDPAVTQKAYTTATRLAIALGLYVYVYQAQFFWFWRSWLKGYQMMLNPILTSDLVFYWMTKG